MEKIVEHVEYDHYALCQDHNGTECNDTAMTEKPHANESYALCGPLLTAFIILGVAGNLTCLCVFLQKRPSPTRRHARLTQPIYVYLSALAAWDLVLLVSSFLLYNLPEITEGASLGHASHLFSLPYVYYATNTAHTCVNWVVVALGLERFFALCYPFKHRLLDGRRRAIYTVCSITMLGAVYSLPRLFETKIHLEGGDQVVEFNRFLHNTWYHMVYKVAGGMFLYSIGPFLCLLFVSIRVSTAVRQQRLFQAAKARRACARSNESPIGRRKCAREQYDCSYSINVMLITVMVKLLFVHSLPTALDITEAAMDKHEFGSSHLINKLVDISILLVVVNSSCNFIVYYVCSRQFREEAKSLLQRCCSTERQPGRKSSDSSTRREYTPVLSDNYVYSFRMS